MVIYAEKQAIVVVMVEQFNIEKFRDTNEESRRETLEFIISTLYSSNNCIDTPQICREKITLSLLEHGQFNQKEIDEIFNEFSYDSTDFSDEFISNNPGIDFMELFITHAELNKAENKIVEVKYNFPSSDCDYKKLVGFCKPNIEIINCPDCGKSVTNTPDNVTWGYEHDLVCPVCSGERKDEFDNRGLIRAGRPKHHGN